MTETETQRCKSFGSDYMEWFCEDCYSLPLSLKEHIELCHPGLTKFPLVEVCKGCSALPRLCECLECAS